ncbi:MAG: hypothetical protein H6838_00515 [Planctomycetes bacterium]|nr:hypothetical protein [Planctomycetota bacterium]MCB9883937.1 hypothetical protein [Planctomycetota bacterium]
MNGALLRSLLVVSLAAAALLGQTRDQRTSPVGMRAYIEQLVLPGAEVVVGKVDHADPVAVRIVKVWPHGSIFRYDLEWTGLEPGSHDLKDYLTHKDGSSNDDLPSIVVQVKPTLAMTTTEPTEPEPVPAPRLAGYRTQQIVFGVLWVTGLLLILFVGRKRRVKLAPPVAKPTLADRLRPLVEAVAADKADTAAKAELERMLVSFWRLRLDLRHEKAVAALAAIRQHPEAGALLRQVELWLHAPEPPRDFDLGKLLEPYRAVTADSLQPIAKEATS